MMAGINTVMNFNSLQVTLVSWHRNALYHKSIFLNLTDNLTLQVEALIFFYSTSLSCVLVSHWQCISVTTVMLKINPDKYDALVSALADLISPTNSASSGSPTRSDFEQNLRFRLAKIVKFQCFLIGPKVKILNTLRPLAAIHVTLFPLLLPVCVPASVMLVVLMCMCN
jgi:hypothetical protein